jgi:hypothetical protein
MIELPAPALLTHLTCLKRPSLGLQFEKAVI